MANLKDINYGIGKYLEASDASALPDIETNRKNLDLLNFKVATNNAYALYNFKDGMIDAYQTEAGVDAGTSTNEIYDSSGKYYWLAIKVDKTMQLVLWNIISIQINIRYFLKKRKLKKRKNLGMNYLINLILIKDKML